MMVAVTIQHRFDIDSTPIRLQFDRLGPIDDLYVTTVSRPLWTAALRPKQTVLEAATICSRPLFFDLLTLKVESE